MKRIINVIKKLFISEVVTHNGKNFYKLNKKKGAN